MNTSTKTTLAPSHSSRPSGPSRTGPPSSPNSAIQITVSSPSNPNPTPNPNLPVAPESATDPEVTALAHRIDELQTLIALTKRRLRLELEYRKVAAAEESAHVTTATYKRIITAVCADFQIAELDLFARTRIRSINEPRQLAIFLMRNLVPSATLQQIANLFSKERATIIHAIRAVENLIATEPPFAARVARIRATLGAPAPLPANQPNT